MKKYEMIPTEEILVQTLSDDILNRNKDIVDFYNLLMAIEDSSTIAIDGRWGSGKTFFVRQSTLVINAKNPHSAMDEKRRGDIIRRLSFAKEEECDNSAVAVYYDAWENDNDTDPILSIIYEIAKQFSIEYDFKDKNVLKIVASIIEAISGKNVTGLLESLKGDNPLGIFNEQKDLEEKIKQFFSEILVERGNRLVVFIDELDRCKPTFAVQLLEQIKHYLSDDCLIFVFSININELQHTIKHYYGNDFDACRYLERFFDLRITLPPADMDKYWARIGLESRSTLGKVILRVIEMYNMELRSCSKFYMQVRAAVSDPIHNKGKYSFDFPDEKGQLFIATYIVPLIIGLKIVDVSLYESFINGINAEPLLELFRTERVGDWSLRNCLAKDESFFDEGGKKTVSKEGVIMQVYNAIFVNKYTGREYCRKIGEYEFNSQSKGFAISASSMLTNYADYSL